MHQSLLREIVDEAYYGNHAKSVNNIKGSQIQTDKSSSSNDLAEFVFYSDRKPRYRTATKLRRQIYAKLKENELLLQLNIKEILQDFVKDLPKNEPINDRKNHAMPNQNDLFHCKCGSLLHYPTTLPCGHTFCKHCVEENMICLDCGYTPITSVNVSPLLVEIISTWFENQYESTGYKNDARNSFSLNDFTEALNSINKAINLVGEDFTSLNIRVEIYINLQKYNVALKDAELSCKINDSCGKSHYIRGLCYVALKDYDQAIDAFQHSLELEPDDMILCKNVITSLCGVFAADVADDDHDMLKKLYELGNLDGSDEDSILKNTKNTKSDESLQNSEKMELLENSEIVYEHNDSEPTSSGITETDSAKLFNDIIADVDSQVLQELEGVPMDLINEDVFECKLCYDLLFKPVTLTCGHVFCKNCLVKTLDYKALCPMCRIELKDYHKDPSKPVTVIIEDILQVYLKEQFNKRSEEYAEKMEKLSRVGIDESVDHPIFICSIAFPHVQCPLHIFEPKYRQMIRDCIESGSRKFGMCSPTMDDSHSDIGTILYIDSHEVLDDGRYILHTVAQQRFICKEKFVMDSLNYAKVEYFQDDQTGLNADQFSELSRATYADVTTYISSLRSTERDCMFNALGPLPPFNEDEKSPPYELPWAWWGLAALPLNFTAKLALLRSKNTVERLGSLRRFLRFLIK